MAADVDAVVDNGSPNVVVAPLAGVKPGVAVLLGDAVEAPPSPMPNAGVVVVPGAADAVPPSPTPNCTAAVVTGAAATLTPSPVLSDGAAAPVAAEEATPKEKPPV